jgi:two-component system, chemotaxis family, sensor kinase CheA
MKVAHTLGAGFVGLVAVFAVCGAFVLSSLRTSVGQSNRDQEVATLAFEYERGALKEQAGAYMFIQRSPEMGRQNLAEGKRAMELARARLEVLLVEPSDRAALEEMTRVEKLAQTATDELVLHAQSSPDDVQRLLVMLRVVEARVQVLMLHTASLSSRTRAIAEQSLGAVSQVQDKVLLSVGIALVLAILTGLALGRRISGPIEALSRGVRRLREGDLCGRIALGTRDEFGALADAFDGMAATLQGTMTELERRTRGMQLVLSNVGQGLVTVDKDGRMVSERSAVLEQWFGKPEPEMLLWSYLARFGPKMAGWLELGWESLRDGVLPLEVCIDQLPQRFAFEGSVYALEYRPILQGGELVQVLVVISDVSAKVVADRVEADQRSMLAMFERIMRDKNGFLDFCEEARELVRRITAASSDPVELKRDIHTLKGNAGMYQLTGIAEFCHDLEDKMVSSDFALDDADRAGLAELWDVFSRRLQAMLGTDQPDGILIEDTEYAEILTALTRGMPRRDILTMIAQWKFESARLRLERLAEQATALATRLGKGPVQVDVEAEGLRLPKQEWSPFWSSLVHVVRNAIDHGLEGSEARSAAGKDPVAHLSLRAFPDQGHVIIEIIDDGAGIAWDKVRQRARERGLPHTTTTDLQAALFADGLSTRDAVSDTSGRGVGMGAALAACRRLGGRVSVESTPRKGTSVRFFVPVQARELVETGPVLASHPPAALAAGLA